MFRYLSVAAIASALVATGCGARSEPVGEPAVSSDASLQAEIDREFSKLSAADRELATAQKLCPVSGEPLGSMGVPIKVTDDGRHLFICCDGCTADAEKRFDEHFAKSQTATK